MKIPSKPEAEAGDDLLGELDAKVVADIIAKHYPQKSKEEIFGLVLDVINALNEQERG